MGAAATRRPAVIKSMVEQEGGRSTELAELIDAVIAQVSEDEAKWVPEIIDHIKKDFIRANILKKGKRPPIEK